MKGKIDAIDFYRKIYSIIGEETPLTIDCGKLCDGACCAVTDEITGMYLFPHEEKMYEKLPAWAEIYDTDFTYSDGRETSLFTCTGKCERQLRPLSCRIFPLVPYAHRGEELKIVMDARGRGMCPLIAAMNVSDLSFQFVKNVKKAMTLCMNIKEIREFIYALTDSIDELDVL